VYIRINPVEACIGPTKIWLLINLFFLLVTCLLLLLLSCLLMLLLFLRKHYYTLQSVHARIKNLIVFILPLVLILICMRKQGREFSL
jgi:hypothetical protein